MQRSKLPGDPSYPKIQLPGDPSYPEIQGTQRSKLPGDPRHPETQVTQRSNFNKAAKISIIHETSNLIHICTYLKFDNKLIGRKRDIP